MFAWALPALAARPLLDQHQWDAYFALFARDVSLPWQPARIRLDTYSGAPVDFAAYNVDPAEVIIAGPNRQPRAIDTSRRKALVRWRFSPPPGYRFESSDVDVPLGDREGFYVIEARRGDAVQQVWLNRTHVGLVTKENAGGLTIWCVDLHSGNALGGTHVDFLVGSSLVSRRADKDGLISWTGRERPSFALAQSGASRAFVSLLPQAPLPAALVGVRLESAVVRAGERIRAVGFMRRRSGGVYRPGAGDVRLSVVGRGKTLATLAVRLDAAGAFSADLPVPSATEDGDYAVLAAAPGGVAGTSVHVDAASGVSLAIVPGCPCNPDAEVPLAIVATRDRAPAVNLPVAVSVVRAPHILPPGSNEDQPRWGTTLVYAATLRSDASGRIALALPPPTDGLDSTYSVRAVATGASATGRLTVPGGHTALAIESDAPEADIGVPLAFEIRAFEALDGTPVPRLSVHVRLSHGSNAQDQTIRLDDRGRGHVVFNGPSLGTNVALADATVDGRRILDATAVLVEPSALSGQTTSVNGDASVVLDRARYRPGDRIGVQASAPGSSGDALITLDGASTYQVRLARTASGRARTQLDLREALGDTQVAVAMVRGGAVTLGFAPLAVDGPGHARATSLSLDRARYAPGDIAHLSVHDGDLGGGATLAVRIADGRESGPAYFDDAPGILQTGGTTSQNPASDHPAWHAWVAPVRSKASDIFAAERPRRASTDVASLGVAAPLTYLWRVERSTRDTLDVPVPRTPGHFVISVLKISDDGDVGAASTGFDVQ